MDTNTARIEVLSLFGCAVAHALAPAQSTQVAHELRRGVELLLAECEGGLDADVDEAIAVQTRALLLALGS